MGSLPISEDILVRALLAVEDAENKAILQKTDRCEITTAELDSKYQEIIKQAKRTDNVQNAKPLILKKRKITAYLIAAVLLAVLLCLSVTAIREPIRNFFIKICNEYTSAAPAEASMEPYNSERIYVGYVPDGYEFDVISSTKHNNRYVWRNGESEIVLSWQTGNVNNTYFMNTEEYPLMDFPVGDDSIMYFYDTEIYKIIWNKYAVSFVIRCPKMLTYEEILRIIESVSIK